jgi:hypothetical protein
MLKFPLLIVLSIFITGKTSGQYDVCVYGGTSAGVIAAYSAAQSGLKVALVEPTNHIGGLTTGGLGLTDIGNKQVIKGLAKQFYRKVGEHYGTLEKWVFEPSVADSIMHSYLKHKNIEVFCGERIVKAGLNGTRIRSITVEQSSGRHSRREIKAKYYIDCSYEGDLMAKSGVSYTVGRESNSLYGETYNGVELMTRHQFPDGIDPYVRPGDPTSGLVWGISPAKVEKDGTADNMVQSYNYRICLTDDVNNMIPIGRPESYDSTRYELLLRLVKAQPEKQTLNDYFIWSKMPCSKTDINNRGGFSTDMIGMNHSYPEADYAERERIIKAHEVYTKGLLYFFGHDTRMPMTLRQQMLQWGYPKDEYVDNGHWTPQLYIREARRMIGEYIVTQSDCEGRRVAEDGVAMAAYQMDSHNCQRVVILKDGRNMVKNEGNVEIGGGLPYPISYRSLTPKRSECTNLIVPVCLSASHIAYGSIRMEPVFMVLGQVSSLAISQAIQSHCSDIQSVDAEKVVKIIEENPYQDGSQPDILIDDSDSCVSYGKEWVRNRKPGGYGLSYLEAPLTSTPARVRFNISNVPTSGSYKVFSYQNVNESLTSLTDVEINTGKEIFHRTISRDSMNVVGQTSGEWMELGSFSFEKGVSAYVELNNSKSDANTRADAILLIRQ